MNIQSYIFWGNFSIAKSQSAAIFSGILAKLRRVGIGQSNAVDTKFSNQKEKTSKMPFVAENTPNIGSRTKGNP